MRTIKSFVLRKGRSRPRHQEEFTHLLPYQPFRPRGRCRGLVSHARIPVTHMLNS